jgi:hypothetical protein
MVKKQQGNFGEDFLLAKYEKGRALCSHMRKVPKYQVGT